MRVRDVMKSNVVGINADTPVNEALAVMQMNNIGLVSVTHEGECVGVLTEEAIHHQLGKRGLDPAVTTASMLMEHGNDFETADQPAIHSVSDDTPLGDALRMMTNHNLHHLVVYNADSEMVGVVSQQDLEQPLLAETIF